MIRSSFPLVLGLASCASGHYATVEPGHAAIVIPHHLAEGTGEGQGSAPVVDPPAEQAREPKLSPPPLSGSAPDPTPLSVRDQWQYAMLYEAGTVTVEHVEPRSFAKPLSTARRMGRFALELWIGHELIDRVRFDFPLIAAEEAPGITRRPLHDAPNLGSHAIARSSVYVPASPRATRLLLIDRATASVHELPWPPDRQPSEVAPAANPAAPEARAPNAPLPTRAASEAGAPKVSP